MKLYIIKHERDNYIHDVAFVDEDMAYAELESSAFWRKRRSGGWDVEEIEIDLPFIGRSVCYVHGDYGIGGGFGTPMHEIIRNSPIYACVNHAKNDELWLKALEYMKDHPDEKYHVADTVKETYIATDHWGEPFSWGHYDGFNVSIKRIRVIKN